MLFRSRGAVAKMAGQDVENMTEAITMIRPFSAFGAEWREWLHPRMAGIF
jgi:hypothetical protein